jgi:hypothetical protein
MIVPILILIVLALGIAAFFSAVVIIDICAEDWGNE